MIRERLFGPRLVSQTNLIYSSLFRVDEFSLGNKDSVEELPLILSIADLADLADLGAAQGKGCVVDAFEDELVLDLSSELNGDAWDHVDGLVLLST